MRLSRLLLSSGRRMLITIEEDSFMTGSSYCHLCKDCSAERPKTKAILEACFYWEKPDFSGDFQGLNLTIWDIFR
jgi:hypothetical protein